MVTLQNKYAAFPTGMFDFNACQDGRFGWFLLTWHPETDPILEEIQTQIKMDFRNSALGQTSKLEIENWLKTYLAEYHWKLHAAFRKTNLKEKGISLLLAVLFDHEVFVFWRARNEAGTLCAEIQRLHAVRLLILFPLHGVNLRALVFEIQLVARVGLLHFLGQHGVDHRAVGLLQPRIASGLCQFLD